MRAVVTLEGKVKWKPSRGTLPQARTCSQAEAVLLLRRQAFDDAVKCGWLKPCCAKHNARDASTKIYSIADVQAVEDRILAGEYPGANKH